MPVQWVNRPDLRLPRLLGTVVSGSVAPATRRVGDLGPHADGHAHRDDGRRPAERGRAAAVTLTLADEIDISRGDVIAASDAPRGRRPVRRPRGVDDDTPLFPGRPYLLKIGAKTVTATVTEIKHKIDVNTSSTWPPRSCISTRSAVANLSLSAPIAFDPTRSTATPAASS
jgi:bifunctional enzyme CysN/CysC